MTHLLDVNVLIALGVADHKSHERVARWIERQRRDLTFELATTAITELGLLRIILELKRPIHQVYVLLEAIKSNRFVRFRFTPTGTTLPGFPIG